MPAPRETKFILRAHRGDGRYPPDDPVFADALAEAAREPELAAWLTEEHARDEIIARKIEAVAPPGDLRDTILAGARASRLARRWWQNPFWMVAAAAIAVVAALPFLRSRSTPESNLEHALIELALRDAGDKNHNHDWHGDAAEALFASLGRSTEPLTGGRAPDFDAMRAAGCKQFQLDGHDVYEICVVRDGRWFHLYAARRPDPNAPASAKATVTERGHVTVASWSTATTLYTLAGTAGRDALRALI
jgi:hypothetical protein